MLSGDPLHCVFPVTPPEGEKTLFVQFQDTSNLVQFKSVYIQEKVKDLPVRGRLRQLLSEREKHGSHRLITGLITDGYKLPKPIQGTLHNQQLCRLQQTKCLMDLYSRPAAERRSQSRSYPRKSGILQPSLPGSKTRQPLEASYRLKFTKQIPGHPKVQDGVHTCLPQERGMGHIYRSHRCLLTHANLHPVSKISQVLFQRHHLPVHQPPLRASNRPLIFTSIVKEVKLIALESGIRLHQYLDDWLIRAPSEQQCTVQTQNLLKLVKDLGFIVNLKKSELKPSQRFDFLGYHFLLDLALVKPTQDRWTKLQEMFHRLSLKSVISARTLMSTIGLLASTEKTVKLGRMHMRPFQWHLKTHWKYPMPLDTLIPWNQKMIRHGEWWLDPQNVPQGEHLHPQTCSIILIAPGWPTKPWFWDKVEMSLDIPRQLPPTRTLLKQPLNNQYHANPTSLNLHVWYLGVQHSKNMVSLQKWQKELLLLRDSQQDPSTHPSGPFSNVGAQKNRWTLGVPQ